MGDVCAFPNAAIIPLQEANFPCKLLRLGAVVNIIMPIAGGGPRIRCKSNNL